MAKQAHEKSLQVTILTSIIQFILGD